MVIESFKNELMLDVERVSLDLYAIGRKFGKMETQSSQKESTLNKKCSASANKKTIFIKSRNDFPKEIEYSNRQYVLFSLFMRIKLSNPSI